MINRLTNALILLTCCSVSDNVVIQLSDSVIELEERFDALISIMQEQLNKATPDTSMLSKTAQKQHKKLQRQLKALTGDKDAESDPDDNGSSNRYDGESKSRFEQLQLIVHNATGNIARASELKELTELVDILAQSSVSVDKFSQLETKVASLAQKCEDKRVLKSIKQESAEIRKLYTKLEDIDNKLSKLRTFLEDIAKISDLTLLQKMNAQIVIVLKMQHKHETHRHNISTLKTVKFAKLRENICDVVMQSLKW